jgi:putative tryptophan/tyrosine transport system substrate-binding protein
MNTRCSAERQFGGHGVKRRSVLAGGAAVMAGALIAPRVAQPAERVRCVGWLSSTHSVVRPTLSEPLRQLGWIEGRNIAFEVGYTEGQSERVLPLAKELVAAQVEIIVAVAPVAIRAARQATNEIPIVMAWWGGPDLVEAGLIASYARPGGNVTGVDMLLSALDAKRLDILRQVAPKATKVAVLIHNRQNFEPQMPPVREVARKAGLNLEIFDTRDGSVSYNEAFDAIARSQSQALLVMSSPLFARDSKPIIDSAARIGVPAIHGEVRNAREGGLIAYGTTPAQLDRQVARQIDKILRGAKPGDLPVEQPSRYELVINLVTARILGLVIPQTLLLQADQVID